MAAFNIKNASIYVGTYKKYNKGRLFGKWFNLIEFADKEDFIKTCAELHKDENDPEYMYQDNSDIPRSFVDESYLCPEFWQLLKATRGMSDEELEAFNIWVNLKEYDFEHYIKIGYDLKDRFFEAWQGKHESLEHYYIDLLAESEYFHSIPDKNMRQEVERYFDFEGYARDQELNDFVQFDDGQVFINLDRGSN